MSDTKKSPEIAPTWPLPFGLTLAQIPETTISVESYTAKSGSGMQRIMLWGSGRVQLWRTLSQGEEPKILEGTIPAVAFVRLLELAEGAAIDSWKPHYEAEGFVGRTMVFRLHRPGFDKVSIVENFEPQAVARVSGALRLAASLARPEALADRFFANF
jgi:hypothetical protein